MVSNSVLLLVMGTLIMIPFCRSFEEETEHPMVTLTAFVALGMYLHTLIFWRQLAAMTFHKVAVVFVPLYFAYTFPSTSGCWPPVPSLPMS